MFIAMQNANWCNHFRKRMFLKKMHIHIACDSGIPLLGILYNSFIGTTGNMFKDVHFGAI